MIPAMKTWVMTYLDPLGIIIGLIVAIPVFWSWWILLGNQRRQQKLVEHIKKTTGDRPCALAISVGSNDIANQVQVHLHDHQLDMTLETCHYQHLTTDSVVDFVKGLRKTRAKLMEKGIGKVHLFYFGPIAGALLIGDVFSNGSVSIYYYNRDKGGYECWGPLTHPMLV